MNFASITRIQSDLAGAGKIEQAAMRKWLRGGGEYYSELASVLREQRANVPWAERIGETGLSRQVC